MALITEDGTGKADAEAYCTLADADAWHDGRGMSLWATLIDAEKEQALRRATNYMSQVYRSRWLGYRTGTTQALDWPRFEVPRPDVGPLGGYIASDAVPSEVRDACAELAFKAASGDLSDDITRSAYARREKVDVIEVEYSAGAPNRIAYRSIDNMLAPYITGGGAMRKVIRA